MFTSGCLESFQTEIRLEHTDYTSFLSLLEYLYTGEVIIHYFSFLFFSSNNLNIDLNNSHQQY